jgi:hypothetical protein
MFTSNAQAALIAAAMYMARTNAPETGPDIYATAEKFLQWLDKKDRAF